MGHDFRRKQDEIDVSVVIMSYNNARFLHDAITSCLDQKDVSVEVIVLDDRSSDDSVSVLEEYAVDPRFKFHVNESNLGQVGNFNRCVRAGKGRYVVVLGSDDVLYPGHLSSLCAAMDAAPQAMLGYTEIDWIDANGQFIRQAARAGFAAASYVGGREEIADLLRYDNYIIPSAVILRRSMLDDVAFGNGALLREGMMAADWELWLRIAKQYPDFVFLKQATVGYRVHEGQVSRQFFADARPLREHTQILEYVLADEEMLRRAQPSAHAIWQMYQKRLDDYDDAARAQVEQRSDRIRRFLWRSMVGSVNDADPFFSIVVFGFQADGQLVSALDNLRDQSFVNFEIITERLPEGLDPALFKRMGVEIISLEGEPGSTVGFWNAALKVARGRYIVYQDPGGVLVRDHLQGLADRLAAYPDVVFYVDQVPVDGLNFEGVLDGVRSPAGINPPVLLNDVLVRQSIPLSALIHPRAAVAEVGNFDRSLEGVADWEFLIRLARKYPVLRACQVSATTGGRNIHSNSPTRLDALSGVEPIPLYREIYRRYPALNNMQIQSDRSDVLTGRSSITAGWGLPDWLSDRVPSTARKHQIESLADRVSGLGTIGAVVIEMSGQSSSQLTRTVESLRTQDVPFDAVWLLGEHAQDLADEFVEVISGDDVWPLLLSARIAMGDTPDLLWFVHAGDCLVPHATLVLAEWILHHPQKMVWYSDEAVLGKERVFAPVLKPDFNIDLLRSLPYVGRNLILRTEAIRSVGGLAVKDPELSELDAVLRIDEQFGHTAIGHVPEVLQYTETDLLRWSERAEVISGWGGAVRRHLNRAGCQATVVPRAGAGVLRVLPLLKQSPLVSIIVSIRDPEERSAWIRGWERRIGYPNYELLFADCAERFEDAAIGPGVVVEQMTVNGAVLDPPGGMSAFAARNLAVAQASGEVLLFLDGSTRPSVLTSDGWMHDLLALALRPDVGGVGTRLDLPGNRGIDQVGLILGLGGVFGKGFHGFPADHPGYMKRLYAQQNVSAIACSCLMMRRSVFNDLEGFDAERFPFHGADADLCLRATHAGYLLVVDPAVVLEHQVSTPLVPAAVTDDEQDAPLLDRWGAALALDPFYHPAFGRREPGFTLSPAASRISRPLPGRPLPVVLAVHMNWQASGHYRVLNPFRALEADGRLEGGLSLMGFDLMDIAWIQPDVVILQGAWFDDRLIEWVTRCRRLTRAKIVLEFDDYWPDLPTSSLPRKLTFPGLIDKLHRSMRHIDWLVVSTPKLAEIYRQFHPDVRVAPNGLCADAWRGLRSRRPCGSKMRVGWAGSSNFGVDLTSLRSVMTELEREVEWVFLGDKPANIQGEHHALCTMARYPALLASLSLDLAVAPFQFNAYNAGKSNINVLELGACGVPVICTDIEPYRDGLPVDRVDNTHDAWIRAIRSHIADPVLLAQKGDRLCEAVWNSRMMQGELLEQWAQAWGVERAAQCLK